jgi:hypothetical protein
MVVGGGASAFDLLDLCLSQGARRIAWVHRDVRWFAPTKKPKAIAGSTRPFARLQAEGLTAAEQSAAIGADLAGRYAKFGVEAIQPKRSLDLRRDQLIPGRARMLADFGALERYPERPSSRSRAATSRSPTAPGSRRTSSCGARGTTPIFRISRTRASRRSATLASWVRGAPASSAAWMRPTSISRASASTASASCPGLTR